MPMWSSGRGRVKDPAKDRRLKENRADRIAREPIIHGGQGRIKHPETDRRLKANRARATFDSVSELARKMKDENL